MSRLIGLTLLGMVLLLATATPVLGTIYWTPAHELAPQGWSSQMTAGDLDGDGDIDISMLRDTPHHFWNIGTSSAPSWELDITQYGDVPSCVGRGGDLGDLDGDGDLDLVVTCWYDEFVRFYWNVGAPTAPVWEEDLSVFAGVPKYVGEYFPRLADMDADGDLDLMLGAWSGRVMYSENVGNMTSPSYAYVDWVENLDHEGNGTCTIALGDMEQDGDLDLVRVSHEGQPECFENVGTAMSFEFEENPAMLDGVWIPPSGYGKGVELSDLDGDSDVDLLIAIGYGTNLLFVNQGEDYTPVENTSWGVIKAMYRAQE